MDRKASDLRSATGADYVIVGAGTAGCVLAARLSEDPAVSVILIEAGPPNRHPFIHVPALVGAAIGTPSINWGFLTEPQAALDGRRVPVPRGRVVGGTGSINGMAYFRGQPQDYDDWASAGNAGWSWHDVLPYFIRSENNADYRGSSWHGQDGPIHVTHIPRPNALNAAFLQAFAEVGGYPACEDFTGPRAEGYGLRQGTIHGGRRDSSAVAYLRPVLSRPNLRLLTDVRVTRVLLDGTRATGVEAIVHGEPQQLRATRETLLCAGAFQSPQLLMLSGIGDEDELRTHGIPLRHHLPGVGRGLHDHPAAPILRETRNTLSYGLSWPTLPRAAWNLVQYLFARSGPLASNVFESTAFIRSGPDADRPDLQIVFQPARRNPNGFPLPLGHGYAISAVNLYPRSRGRIRLASRDPLDPPRIDPNLLGDPRDFAALLAGLRLGHRLLDAPAFARYAAVEVAPGADVNDDAALTAYVRRTATTVHHPVGSCRMGRDEGSVVDDQLRVHGIDALRVIDASVFPSIIGGNTNAPVVMVAEKASDLLRGRAAPPPAGAG
jgi:choline dehydrogenase